MFEKLEALEKTYEDLNTQMTDNEIISDQTRYTKIAKQHRPKCVISTGFRHFDPSRNCEMFLPVPQHSYRFAVSMN